MIVNAKKQLLKLPEGILLGLSGGPDSMCLCALLMECNIKFHIAHIDHGLFIASSKEKERLEIFAKKNSIPFHLCSLNASTLPNKNLEEVLRDRRLQFFSAVMKNNSLKILLLGHQKDEKAETMIKRFFEGGSLFNLPGIRKRSTYAGMDIFRPLLDVSKESIIGYLNQKGIPFYTDLSNFTGDNLRAKMRRSLIPKLEGEFGKNIVTSICDLGDQVEEMRSYIEKQVAAIKGRGMEGEYGIFYPYINSDDCYLFTLLILDILKEKAILISREQKLYIKEAVLNKVSGKRLVFERFQLHFDQRGVFLVSAKLNMSPLGILDGDIDWLDFWKGEFSPHKIRRGSMDEYKDLIDRKKLSEYHRKRQTPLWLRPLFPIPLTTIGKKIKI